MAELRTSSSRWYWVAQLFFAVLGLATSVYLLVQHTRLKSGIQGDSALCNLGQRLNCNIVQASQYSEIGGVPLALWGVLYFLALFLLGAFYFPGTKGFRSAQGWMARLATLALVVDVWLLGIQAFSLGTFCLFCLLTYLCTGAHLFLNGLQLPPGQRNARRLWSPTDKQKFSPFALSVISIALLATGIGLYQYSHKTITAARSTSLERSRANLLQTWANRPSQTIPTQSTDPVWGATDPKVKVVVFSDFECPHCQKAAFALHTALGPERDFVQMTFKNFPLDNSCNPLMERPLHVNACALSHLGYCANQKGKFWDYHDRVFFRLSPRELSSSHDELYQGVKTIFTRKEFDECLRNPAALANTQADIEQGRTLPITSTPTLFINGKRLDLAPTVDLLRELVRIERKLQE